MLTIVDTGKTKPNQMNPKWQIILLNCNQGLQKKKSRESQESAIREALSSAGKVATLRVTAAIATGEARTDLPMELGAWC